MADAMLDARQDGGSYRRIEVITGQRQRRRWTAQEKAARWPQRWRGNSPRTLPIPEAAESDFARAACSRQNRSLR